MIIALIFGSAFVPCMAIEGILPKTSRIAHSLAMPRLIDPARDDDCCRIAHSLADKVEP